MKSTNIFQRVVRLAFKRPWTGAKVSWLITRLFQNGFAVPFSRWPRVFVDLLVGLFFNSPSCILKEVIYSRRIAKFKITTPPLFIIGHWRSGTSLLHELLSLDPRHAYPNYFQCMAPEHFLLTEKLTVRLFPNVVPKKRIMDNMQMGWKIPLEDEYGICNLGISSSYTGVAFPNKFVEYGALLNYEELPLGEKQKWKKAFYNYLKELSYRNSGRLILKSPPHSFRIKVLKELFPDAKFVHIYRNPYKVYPSIINMWKLFIKEYGYQKPDYKFLEEYVLSTYLLLHSKIKETKSLLNRNQFYELKYEDLVKDPLGEMGNIYSELKLGDFEEIRDLLSREWESRKGFKTNRFEMDKKTLDKITNRWGYFIKEYGYPLVYTDSATSPLLEGRG